MLKITYKKDIDSFVYINEITPGQLFRIHKYDNVWMKTDHENNKEAITLNNGKLSRFDNTDDLILLDGELIINN